MSTFSERIFSTLDRIPNAGPLFEEGLELLLKVDEQCPTT